MLERLRLVRLFCSSYGSPKGRAVDTIIQAYETTRCVFVGPMYYCNYMEGPDKSDQERAMRFVNARFALK